jgi:tetratricopeptide (TPR) repeat protein
MKQNKTISKHFKWLKSSEQQKLKQLLLMKSAMIYEQSENWHDAAECWKDLGQYVRASNLYQKNNNNEAAANQLLDAGQYEDAFVHLKKWEEEIQQNDHLNRFKLRLSMAACHFLGTKNHANTTFSRQSGKAFYNEARKILSTIKQEDHTKTNPFMIALAEYGRRMQRFDLIQEGYENIVENIDSGHASTNEIQELMAYQQAAAAFHDELMLQKLKLKNTQE